MSDQFFAIEKCIQPLCQHIVDSTPEGTGFVLLLCRFDGDETTFGSNCNREDAVKLIRELADVLEERRDRLPFTGGQAKGRG